MAVTRKRMRGMRVPALLAVCLCCLPPPYLTLRASAGLSCGRSFKRARPRTHQTMVSQDDTRQPAAGVVAGQSARADHVELDSQGKVIAAGC